MTTDAWLAIAHHLAIFGVFAVLVAEWAIVRPGMAAAEVSPARRAIHLQLAVFTAMPALAALMARGIGP